MPRLLEKDMEKAAESYKVKTGVGCHGFHPKVPLDFTKETSGKVVELLEKVEQCGRSPQQACTMMFFLIPENATMIRWWEALRAPQVVKWQQLYRIE